MQQHAFKTKNMSVLVVDCMHVFSFLFFSFISMALEQIVQCLEKIILQCNHKLTP